MAYGDCWWENGGEWRSAGGVLCVVVAGGVADCVVCLRFLHGDWRRNNWLGHPAHKHPGLPLRLVALRVTIWGLSLEILGEI